MSVEEILTAITELPEGERRKVYVELEAKRRSDPAAQLSAHDRAKHLIGSIEGPSDLSTNKAYLEGLGESSLL